MSGTILSASRIVFMRRSSRSGSTTTCIEPAWASAVDPSGISITETDPVVCMSGAGDPWTKDMIVWGIETILVKSDVGSEGCVIDPLSTSDTTPRLGSCAWTTFEDCVGGKGMNPAGF